jgi:hypothetical protein
VYRTFPRGSHDPARAPRPRRPRRLQLEPLEGRQLMSLGNEFIANTTVRNDQLESDGAIAANGISVAVWVDTFSGTDHDIRAQIYNADGTLRGKEIVVEGSSAEARRPSVAIDDAGNFVVAWEQTVNGQKDIRAELYTDTGIKTQPNTIKVTTDGRNEFDPDVAMDGAGNWVVAYSLQFSPTDVDVRAARFSGSGNFFGNILVATSGALDETSPSVAFSKGGNFDVAYQTQAHGSTQEDVRLDRFDAQGGLLGSLPIANSGARERRPSVAMDDAGNAIVAYEKLVGSDFDIKAKRVSIAGVAGSEINIRNTTAQERNPTIALERTGGSFVVAYETDLLGVPGNRTVEVAEFDPSNVRGLTLNLPAFPNSSAPALSINGQGDYFLTFTAGDGGTDKNVHFRRGHLS